MSEVTGDPSVQSPEAPTAPPEAAAAAPAQAESGAAASEMAAEEERRARKAGVRELLEAGAHFGHQTRRWNPQMKPFIFGERNGIHIIDLDQTAPRLETALAFIRETVASGGKVLFVGTKRAAQDAVKGSAERAGQFYVNNRWLGGMLTNFRTVKKSIELFKEQIAVVEDEEKSSELSKKELSRLNRSITKYRKSLDGLKEMTRLPDALFVIDLNKEHIAVTEAKRLGIPVVAIVDTNCSPNGIEFAVPANDDAIRAIELYCDVVANACAEGAELFNERAQAEPEPAQAAGPGGRRVVEIKQQPRRGRQAGGAHSAGPRPQRRDGGPPRSEAAPAEEAAAEAPAAEAPAAPAADAPAAPAAEAPEAPASEPSES